MSGRPPWSEALERYRHQHCGGSWSAAARALAGVYPRGTVSPVGLARAWRRWEVEGMWPRAHVEALIRLLAVPAATFDRRWQSAAPGSGLELPWGPGPTVAGEWEDADMIRRTFLAGVAGVAATVGLGAVAPVRGEAGIRRVGMADVEQIRGVTELFRSVDYAHGGGQAAAEAAQFADRVATLLYGEYTEAVGRRLHSAVATMRQLAGWMALDTGNVPEARRHWLAAQALAKSAGDQPLIARVLYCHAQEARDRADWPAMWTHLDAARTVAAAAPATTATTRAMLAAFAAMSSAALGRDSEALALLGEATDAMAHSDPAADPPWVLFFDAAEYQSASAHVYRELARRRSTYGGRALDGVTAALELYPAAQARSRALVTASAAGTAFIAREPGAAVQLARDAMAQAEQLQSARVRTRLASLARELAPWARRPAVAELARDLAALH